ncbi:Afadin and alpha-actinin-binding-domain-containing protein [Irpex lacteus]|nr:Afadin and alpha-actinin-binding-domain-containing protein [Irpex lacteus]
MAATPKKLVHWALDLAKSPSVSSPGSESSTDSCSSSLPYINSQLIAHGYTHQPGISLEGTSKDDAERVVKCLLSMLSQRMDDISRTEDLSTKIRTLSYDHERLMSMYRTATETAANAEREMNLHKSRLASANRTLQSTETAHKQTTLELQRTRTALQAIRTTHQTEIKKLEKEKDKILERWNKLADTQLNGNLHKSGPAAGFHCANAEVVGSSDVQLRGKGTDLLEVALEQAARARHDLLEENERLKGIIMSTANELQRTMYTAQCYTSPERPDEPVVLTSMELFPFAPANAAWDIISSLLDGIKQQFEPLMHPDSLPGSIHNDQESKDSDEHRARAREVEKLQAVIANLTSELNDAQTQAKDYATQAKEMFEKFAAEQQRTNATIHSKIVAAQDEENERLTQRERELDEERQRLTDAVINLGREKAALETERIQFLEERRTWQMHAMMTDIHSPSTVPPEAGPSRSFAEHIPAEAQSSPKRSPARQAARKSPRKSKSSVSIGVSGAKKATTRAPRRSSGVHKAKSKGKEKASSSSSVAAKKVIPSYETEVIVPRGTHAQPSFKTQMTTSRPQAPPPKANALPAFVLPPPSPVPQLPPRDSIFTANPMPPLPKLNFPEPSHTPEEPLLPQQPQPTYAAGSSSSTTSTNPFPQPQPQHPPTTPGIRRPFPMAKPLAPHMVHAYSPVKPSPLSRLLRLGNSPDSPDAPPLAAPTLGTLAEAEDESGEFSVSPTPAPRLRHTPAPVQQPQMSLAAELGVSEDDDSGELDSPLRDRVNSVEDLPPRPTSALGRYHSAKDKGKGKAKAQPQPSSSSRTRAPAPTAVTEKPRPKTRSSTGSAAGASKPKASSSKVIGGGVAKKTTRMTRSAAASVGGAGPSNSRSATSAKPTITKSTTRGGPRRVPIGSSQAAALPTWKG